MMKGAHVILAAALLVAHRAGAQSATIDATQVEACLAQTPIGVTTPACIGTAANACQDATPDGQNTLGISTCLQAETAEWDALLNREYQALRAQLAQQPGVADRLRDAQRAWIAFRDADCALAYALWGDGSMRTIAAANCQLVSTAQRTIALRDMQ